MACNIRCSYCYQGLEKDARRMTVAHVKGLASEARRLGARQIYFTGGEPLLYPELFEVLEHAAALGYEEVALVSNATLLTREVCRRLYDLRVNVCVGVYTSNPDLGRIMYPGSFERSLEGIENLLEQGYGDKDRLVAITLTAMADNVDTLLEQYDWILKKGLTYGGFHPVVPSGCADLRALPEVERLREVCFELARRRGLDPAEITPFVQPRGCRPHAGQIHVTVDCRAKMCPPATFDIGSLQEYSLEQIWSEAPVYTALRSFSQLSDSPCARCPRPCYGCRIAALADTGDLLGPYNFCWHAKEVAGAGEEC
jgi:MoaA/NifB/PqqE/SkfB family radical SAM enzyme